MQRSDSNTPLFGTLIAVAALTLGVLGLGLGEPSHAPVHQSPSFACGTQLCPQELVVNAVVRASGVDRVAGSPTLPATVRFEPPWTRGEPRGASAVVTRGDHPRPSALFVESLRTGEWVRWELAEPPSGLIDTPDRFLFSEHLGQAEVSVGEGDVKRVCGSWLFGRWQCGPDPWIYVGESEIQVRGRPQRCIWAHPSDEGPLEILFRDVPLGNLISGRHMLADLGVRNAVPGDVTFRIWVNDELLGERTQAQREGLSTFRFSMPDAEERGDVRFEIRADVTAQRHFCFTAQTRSAPSIGMGRSGFDPRGDRSSRSGRIRADGSGESLEETADGNSDSLDIPPLPEGSE